MDIADDFFALDLSGFPMEQKIQKLEEWYETLPEPKTAVRNSYLIVWKIGILALKANLLDVAEKWAEIGMQYEGIHNLGGEGAFQVGVVAFAKGDLEKAKQYVKMAKKNSGWRNFRNKDPAYRALIDKKKQ